MGAGAGSTAGSAHGTGVCPSLLPCLWVLVWCVAVAALYCKQFCNISGHQRYHKNITGSIQRFNYVTLSFKNILKIHRENTYIPEAGFSSAWINKRCFDYRTGSQIFITDLMGFVHFLRLANVLCNNEMKSRAWPYYLEFVQHFNFFSWAGVLQKKMKTLQKNIFILEEGLFLQTHMCLLTVLSVELFTFINGIT